MAPTLTDWLASLTAKELSRLVAARPEAVRPPAPANLAELAERLSAPHSVVAAVHQLPTPAIQVLEVLQLLNPGGGDRAALASWLGVTPDDPGLTATLDLLGRYGLVWPDGPALRMVAPLYQAFEYPLGLGAPAAGLLGRCQIGRLRAIAGQWGLPTPSRKSDLVAAIAAKLSDADLVRSIVAEAEPATKYRLRELAHQGPGVEGFTDWYGYHYSEPELRWASDHGLLLPDGWGVPQLAQEVAVALRGPGWHAPFTPDQPELALAPADPATVAGEAAAAGSAAVEAIAAVLATVEAAPVALLKSGGVGVKELRRLAKSTGYGEPAVRLWLELSYEAELVAVVPDRAGGGQLLPTPEYDEWLAADPAGQLAAVLGSWLAMAAAPLVRPLPGAAKSPPALLREHPGQLAATVRRQLLQLLLSVPAGQGVTDPGGVTDALCWLSPLGIALTHRPDELVAAGWQEAHWLGVLAHGSVSPLGQALAGDPDQLAAACQRLLPPATAEAVFQADLTALVPGAPARALAEVLDAAADRESSGAAVTWRFSASSVRRALDTGWAADALLAALQDRAAGDRLPQPLAYLVNDVARRHGAIRVRQVGCVLHADDPALVAELANARELRSLSLAPVAATVLTCPLPVEQALAALRKAGYAPVAESPDGVPQLAKVPQRRAARPRRQRPPQPPQPPVNAGQLAQQLLTAPVPAAPATGPDSRSTPGSPGAAGPGRSAPAQRRPRPEASVDAFQPELPDLGGELVTFAGHLPDRQRRLLAEAIEKQQPVTIAYLSLHGERTVRVIDAVEIEGSHLVAWCQLRDDERRFALRRIESVTTA